MVSLGDDFRKVSMLSDAGRQWIPVCVSLELNVTHFHVKVEFTQRFIAAMAG